MESGKCSQKGVEYYQTLGNINFTHSCHTQRMKPISRIYWEGDRKKTLKLLHLTMKKTLKEGSWRTINTFSNYTSFTRGGGGISWDLRLVPHYTIRL